MKKLLSILTISTLTASIPVPLMAMKSSDDEWEIINKDDIPTPNRVKRNVGSVEKDVTDGLQINIKDSDKIWIKILNPLSEINPKERCWYFIIVSSIGLKSWNQGIYASSELKWDFANQRLTFPDTKPIGGVDTSISLDKSREKYFIYKWTTNWGSSYIPKEPKIDKNANIIDLNIDVSPFQKGIKFSLADDKNGYWIKPYQLVSNGQVKVKIANTDINTVKVNGVIMPSPDKNWDFDLPEKSTTIENKDYQIEIAFKLDGKSYTGQIIVSSLLSQPSITVQKNTSPFGNVASYVYQVPTNDKVGDFTLTSNLYYSDTEVKVSLNKPTGSTVQSGVVYGLNDKWQKNGQQLNITGDVSLNATMLNSYQGRFLVETKDSADNSSFYYISLNKDNLTPNFWNTNKGQQFYDWASLNGYSESIKKLNATELNKIINESKNWQQIASDSQLASVVADWFKTNGKLLSKEPLTAEQVVEQLKTQIPSSIIIAGVNTSNYDVNKVLFVLNQNEFNPNDKAKIIVKYNSATSEQFTLQIKDSKTSDNNKGGDSKLWIIGVVVGVLAGVGIAYLLFKRFVFDKYFLPKIKKRRHDKLVEQVRKEEAEKEKQNNKGGE
ncbi:hypothetical protein [Spiroplasma endosymbiont of Glossina fuscipes fuscipes]|uniref:hypothetical protein n=1 Tax=Spiroplasma endosymbiont of Glossina fuscipes fuscipes TaxID=2004463 RepID=UPI003C750480